VNDRVANVIYAYLHDFTDENLFRKVEEDIMPEVKLILKATKGNVLSERLKEAEYYLFYALCGFVICGFPVDNRNWFTFFDLLEMADINEKQEYSDLDVFSTVIHRKYPDSIYVDAYKQYKQLSGSSFDIIVMSLMKRLKKYSISANLLDLIEQSGGLENSLSVSNLANCIVSNINLSCQRELGLLYIITLIYYVCHERKDLALELASNPERLLNLILEAADKYPQILRRLESRAPHHPACKWNQFLEGNMYYDEQAIANVSIALKNTYTIHLS